MGSLWDKRLVGATDHASQTLMACHKHNALMQPLMLPKDEVGDQMQGHCSYLGRMPLCGAAQHDAPRSSFSI
jgi:hypothetical protein